MEIHPLMILLGQQPYGSSPEDETDYMRWALILGLLVGFIIGGMACR